MQHEVAVERERVCVCLSVDATAGDAQQITRIASQRRKKRKDQEEG